MAFKDKPSGTEMAAGCGLMLLLMPITVLLNSWALRTLWGWFVVPLGVLPLGTVQAIGVASLVSLLTYKHTDSDTSNKTFWSVVSSAALQSLFRPVFAVAFCAFVRWCAS
jgi:hypothetical protein